jgi:DNA protecting protein DprA
MGITTLFTRAIPAFQTIEGKPFPGFIDFESNETPESVFQDLPEFGLAIVGTRQPERRSLEQLERTLDALHATRLVIVSGFARGIDAAAHELAARMGMKTVAILGCGIDIDYPKGNRALRGKILDAGGALVSPFPRGTAPWAGNFLQRNALIAGLSRAVWVVEAAAASGTLNTANWATRLNRDLYATSCFPGDHRFEGNEKLLSQRTPDRYPVAQSFFGPHSLASTWPGLAIHENKAPDLKRQNRSLSPIQRWVLEIRNRYGECHLPALLGRASSEGIPRGALLQILEVEFREGRLKQESDGRIEPGAQVK